MRQQVIVSYLKNTFNLNLSITESLAENERKEATRGDRLCSRMTIKGALSLYGSNMSTESRERLNIFRLAAAAIEWHQVGIRKWLSE